MALPTVHETLAALEEALELGEQEEVSTAIADLGAALAKAPASTELQAQYAALVQEVAAVPLDRGQCVVLVRRMHNRLERGPTGAIATIAAPPATSAPAPVARPAPAVAEPRWTVAADSVDVMRDFAVEARALLDEAEQAFLALEAEGASEGIATAFRAFHTIKGVAGFLELDVLAETAHRTESLLAEVRDGVLPAGPCIDVVLSGVDLVRALIDCALRGQPFDLAIIEQYYQALAAAAQGRTAAVPAPRIVTPAEVAAAISELHEPPVAIARPVATVVEAAIAPAPAPSRPTPVAAPAAPAPAAPAAPAASAAPAAPAAAQANRRDDDGGTVKVDTYKMDGLVDLVGELAIAQAQLASDPTLVTLSTPSLLRSISALSRVARELQRAALAMRMVAIKGTFDRMARVARDTARSLGKPISFVIDGAQTELDRTMVEAIYDPLVHLVRNSIDHGIEGSIERARRGKPTTGTLTLRAYHHAGQVVVEIVDDGGGLDRERILERARSRGVIAPDAVLTPDEIHHLIFMPGFSTAAQVTAVSGRGVGMDVVKTNIERVRGRVEIDSTPGHGTTIRLKLPLTLAIIDGLLVGVGAQRYVLPATWAREIFRPSADQRCTIQGRGQMVKVRGTLYPVHRLSNLLGVVDGGPGDGVMIMVDHGTRAVCLEVEHLLGKQEVVVKGLGAMFSAQTGVAGGAILGDGRIALILDIPTLLGAPSGLPERQVA